jgi:hypothetical protein
MYTYSEDLLMTAFFTLMVLVAGSGVTPAGGAVPATAMVTDPVAKAAGSVPISWRPGSGGEAGGLQTENVSGLAAGQSLGYSSPLRFSRGAGEKVVQSRDVGLWGIASVQLCESL